MENSSFLMEATIKASSTVTNFTAQESTTTKIEDRLIKVYGNTTRSQDTVCFKWSMESSMKVSSNMTKCMERES